MPQAGSAERIRFHRNRANDFLRLSRMRHRRAAMLARRALSAQRAGRPAQARKLMQEALKVKAAAGRAGVRSQNHRARLTVLRTRRAAQVIHCN